MDYSDIKKLIEDMGNSNLDSLEIEFPEGTKIRMSKNSKKEVTMQMPSKNVIEAGAPMTVPVVKPKEERHLVQVAQEDRKEENYQLIKSPMVGTFYASASPDKEPFVKVGDKIHKGQVVCIVEAMKLMNEIESELEGEIIEICVKDGEVVEYGKPLFKIK